MPQFGKTSRKRLENAHASLQEIFNEVVKVIDCSVLESYRDEETQNRYFDEGKSKVKYPNGRHNKLPSLALGIASQMGHKIRWGGDWNNDFAVADNRFDDFPHFELVLK